MALDPEKASKVPRSQLILIFNLCHRRQWLYLISTASSECQRENLDTVITVI